MTDFAAPGYFVAIRPPKSKEEVRVDERVLSLSFEDNETKADKLTLIVDNYDLTLFDSPLWQPGNDVLFQFGYPGAMSPHRTMRIQKVRGFDRFTVEALGNEVLMNRVPRIDRVWEKVKRSDVVREVVRRYGYTDAQMHIEDTKIIVPQVTQGNLTDYQLVKSLAAREGFEFYVDFDGVHFHKRNTKQKPLRILRYFTDPGMGEIVSVTFDDDRSPIGPSGAVALVGRDPDTKKKIVGVGSDATTADRTVLATERTAPEPFDEIDPIRAVLVNKLVPPASANAQPPAEKMAQADVRPTTEVTEEAAQRLAAGVYLKQQLKSVKLSVTARGDAGLLAKSIVRIEGIGQSLSGLYHVNSVKHDLDAGYRMVMKVTRDGRNPIGGAGAFVPTTAKTDASQNPSAKDPTDVANDGPIEVIDPVTATTRFVTTHGRDSGVK